MHKNYGKDRTCGSRDMHADIHTSRQTRSSMDYSLPRLRTKFGERAFSHASPATWNALPGHIRTVADPVKFRKLLKSHYLVKLLIFVDFCVCFLCVLSFGWLLKCTYGLGPRSNGRTVNIWHDMMWWRDRNKPALRCRVIIIIIRYEQAEGRRSIANNWRIKSSVWMLRCYIT